MKFGVIGAGIVGTAIAIRLQRAGYQLMGLQTRSESSLRRFRSYLEFPDRVLEEWLPEADLIFITTQDEMIPVVAHRLTAEKLYRPGQVWIHCSGSMPAKVMQSDEALPIQYLSIHPLQAFADIDQALTLFERTHFGIEGEAVDIGQTIVRALGGISQRLDSESKSLYHAGAVVASNYLVTIAELAVRLLEEAGIKKEAALQSLLPLMEGTLNNLNKLGLPQALTGPIARGDMDVIRKHLLNMPEEIAEIYRPLGKYTLKIGREKRQQNGAQYSETAYEELERILD